MTQEIVLEGTVADLEWKNPHIFMTVEAERADGTPSAVEVEVTSISEAQALGLPKEAIAPGSRVVVRAHPGLTLTPERTQLEYVLTLEDPDMLIGPASYTAMWDHRPDLAFSGEPCDPDVARRAVQQ